MGFTKEIGLQRLYPVRIQAAIIYFNYMCEIECWNWGLNIWLKMNIYSIDNFPSNVLNLPKFEGDEEVTWQKSNLRRNIRSEMQN